MGNTIHSGSGPRSSVQDHPAGARSSPRVSVIIPTYSDAYLLRKSLPVLLRNPPDEIEVVIVNNDPSQDVAESIGELAEDRRVAIVNMGFEAGFARAINRGIRQSTGELVMFCNADVFPSTTYLAEMDEFFADHPRAGAAIGKLLRYDLASDRPTDILDVAALHLTRQRRMMPLHEGQRDDGRFDQPLEVFALDGAAMVARRAALAAISIDGEYLDENFVMHKDDLDVSWRLHLAGWQCWYNPIAVAHHGRTTRGLGSTRYLSAVLRFHQNERKKSQHLRIHAMKNQWLMLIKHEDLYNFRRDFPFILAREGTVLIHNLLFAPRALVAVPMTVKVLRDTLRKRRAANSTRDMEPHALRRWLVH